MKAIGLLGGMSWQSTLLYYQCINQEIKERLGGFHSAKIVMVSLDFHEIELLLKARQWDRVLDKLVSDARRIEAAGADFLLICTNTMHRLAPEIQARISIPLVHIADAAAEHILSKGIRQVGLLGTRFTMEEDFYKKRLMENHGIEVIVPSKDDITIVDRIIFEELCLGIVNDASRREYLRVMDQMHRQGAQGIVEGCTEIAMLVNQEHTPIQVFDSTEIHAKKAVSLALDG